LDSHIAISCCQVTPKNGNKTAKINVRNFHGSLTTVVKAQNDTSKTANITDTIFDRKNDITIATIDIAAHYYMSTTWQIMNKHPKTHF